MEELSANLLRLLADKAVTEDTLTAESAFVETQTPFPALSGNRKQRRAQEKADRKVAKALH